LIELFDHFYFLLIWLLTPF